MDTISDMLTQIRNAYHARKEQVVLSNSKFKAQMAKLLVEEGWLNNMSIKEQGRFKQLVLELKYNQQGEAAISGIKRVSKPGQRIYMKNADLPKVLGGLGITVVSTSKGLMTDKLARKQKVGGEVICQIW